MVVFVTHTITRDAWRVLVAVLWGCTLALRMVSMTGGGAVRSGGSATLRCTYDLEGAQLYSIKWYRNEDEFYRYVPKESPPALVFSLPGVHVDLSASNDQRVTLTGVHRQLAGLYHCEVSADAPLFHTEIQATRLEIVDVPETAVILSVDRQRYSPGDSIRANCSTSSSYPAANLTWYLNNDVVTQTYTTTLPLDPDLWETSSSFSIIEVTTEEDMQHPKYTVGGTQQEISSSQLKVPSQNPEITVYTAYSSIQPNAHDRKTHETAENFETPYKYNEVRKEDVGFRDEVKDGTRGLEQGFREYPLRVSAVPLKVTRVRVQPGSGSVVKLRCEATIYDVYKASSEEINVREEQPNSALVMGQSSGSSVTNRAFGVVSHCFLIAGINCLHTVWKVLISGR